MKLAKHVFTGSDDNTDVEGLLKLSNEYKYVEWGVLIANNEFGNAKYPSREWFAQRRETLAQSAIPTEWSLHVCDEWAGDLAHGIPSVFTEAKDVVCDFNRMQINFFREITDGSLDVELLVATLLEHGPEKQYIFQLTGWESYYIVAAARKAGIDALGFFDPSAGRGISPSNGWPTPPAEVDTLFGFAGGLGPHNLAQALADISPIRSEGNFWVDMETNVRSNGRFDFTKVRACLDISKSYI